MAEMNAAFFEEAKYNLQHGKINFLNVAGLIPEVAEIGRASCRERV